MSALRKMFSLCVSGLVLHVGFALPMAYSHSPLADSAPPSGPGMTIKNETDKTIYVSYDPGPGPIVNPVAPKGSIRAKTLFNGHYPDDKQAYFGICTGDGCLKESTMLCGSADSQFLPPATPSNPIPLSDFNLAFYTKYGGIKMPEPYTGLDNATITVAPTHYKGKDIIGCFFNIPDLPRYDVEHHIIPSRVALAGPAPGTSSQPLYDQKDNPLLTPAGFFVDHNASYNYKIPGSRLVYFYTIQKVGDATPSKFGSLLGLAADIHNDGANPNYRTNIYATRPLPEGDTNTYQINICACDPNINPADSSQPLLPGQGGVCPQPTWAGGKGPLYGMVDCDPSKENYGNGTLPSGVANDQGPVYESFKFSIYNGIYALTPADIMNKNGPVGGHSVDPNTLTRLTVPFTLAGGTLDVSQYFANTDGSAVNATYSIVQGGQTIPDRNGTWGPVFVHLNQPGTDASSYLTINGATLKVAPVNDDSIIQLTVKATENGHSAYETLYLNLSNQNQNGYAVYTPLKPGLSAWLYGTDFGQLADSKGNCLTTMTPASSCNSNSPDYPNCQFVAQINKHRIHYVTPDTGWVQFGTQDQIKKYWDFKSPTPLNNNIDNNNDLYCTAKYYNTNAPNTQFLIAYEFDNPLLSLLPNLQTRVPADDTQQKTSQLTQLVANLGNPVLEPKKFANIAGISFDLEPFKDDATSALFYKRFADYLAREGKIVEAFAFAQAMPPSVIMAMGPLGIMLPSYYDIGGPTDPNPNFFNIYKNNFGITDSTPDFACHAPITPGTTSMPIESYCDINLHNTLYSNAHNAFNLQWHGGPDVNDNLVFTTNMKVYGGHFQTAMPSEGSAMNWSQLKIYNPTEQARDPSICGPNNPHCTAITGQPSNFQKVGGPDDMDFGKYTTVTDDTGTYNLVYANPNNDTNILNPQETLNQIKNQSYQNAYIQAFIDYAVPTSSNPVTQYFGDSGGAVGRPVSDQQGVASLPYANPSNLGMALYGLSVPEVYACAKGEKHGERANCLVPLPISTPDYLPGTDIPNPVWDTVEKYTYNGQLPVDPTVVIDSVTADVTSEGGAPSVEFVVKVQGNLSELSGIEGNLSGPGSPQPVSPHVFSLKEPLKFTNLLKNKVYTLTITTRGKGAGFVPDSKTIHFTSFGSMPVKIANLRAVADGNSANISFEPQGDVSLVNHYLVNVWGPKKVIEYPASSSLAVYNLVPGQYKVTVVANSDSQEISEPVSTSLVVS